MGRTQGEMKIYISDEAIDKFGKDELIDMFKSADCEYYLEHTIKKYYPNGILLYEMSDMGDAYLSISDEDSTFNLLEDLKD